MALKTTHYLLILLSIIFLTNSCIVVPDTFTAIPPGPWRAVLKLDPKPVVANPRGEPREDKLNLEFEEVTEGDLPFNFEVTYENETDFYIEIKNGEETIRLDDIDFGRSKSRAKDSIVIRFPGFGTYIKGFFEESIIEGRYYAPERGNYSVPFVARHGKDYRFTALTKAPMMDISGKWEVDFEIESDNPYKAIGEFEQDGNYLTGTFLTETGDYRFLEGTVQDNKVYLSTFDGTHMFLFEAKILEDSTLVGGFRSGTHYQTSWKAKRNEAFKLADADSLTFLKPGYDKISFEFENPSGELISLEDPKYDNKVKIIQILGTWCPNCRDETKFLLNYLKENPSDQLEIIGLAFEKYKDTKRANGAIQRMKDYLGIPYEIVWAGPSSKEEAARSLPMLNHILSYPTMIIIDKEDNIRRIHTGFSGPATSEFKPFKEEFERLLGELLE